MSVRKPLVLVDGEMQQLQAADWIDLSDDINLTVTSPITLTGDDISLDETAVDHDNLLNFVGNEHIDHTAVSISSGSGLTGGGTIDSNQTLALDINGLSVAVIAAGDFIPFWDITATATNKKITFANFEGTLNHDSLSGVTANEHIDWTSTNENLSTSGSITTFTLTDGRVVLAGTAGILEDSADLTFDGTTLDSKSFGIVATLSSTVGVISQAGVPFAHTYNDPTADGANFFIGKNAGNFILSPAGGSSVLASRNFGAGEDALRNLSTGRRNFGLGSSAGRFISTGSFNIAIGATAMYSMLGGSSNIAIGESALAFNTSGNYNTTIGDKAGFNNLTGWGNTFIGFRAGYTHNASYSICIGRYAGYHETAGNTLFIDYNIRASQADARVKAMIYGMFAPTAVAQNLTFNAQVGINIPPTAWLTLPAGSATAGTAPLKFTTGALTTAAVDGQLEYLSNVFYIRGSDNLDVAGTGKFSKVLTPEIKTDTSTPTDLTITTGAAKTLILGTSVYNDLQFPVATGKVTPASGEPSWETFTANTKEFAFDINDYIDLQANELLHNWKEGTDGHLHIHYTLKTAQSTGADRFVKFSIWVAYSDKDEVWVEQAVLSFEDTVPTGSLALQAFYLDMGNATLTNYLRGGQVKVRVKRIAATGGTEYADDVYITQVGMHLEMNKIGSVVEED